MSEERTAVNVRKRNLKVSYGDFNDRTRIFHPLIRLHGKYLLHYGFNVGDTVEVSINTGEITIKKVVKETTTSLSA